MGLTAVYERLQSELFLHGAQDKLYIEAATVAVLFYVALTDFLTFKIRNELIVLLLILIRAICLRYAVADRSTNRYRLATAPAQEQRFAPLQAFSSARAALMRPVKVPLNRTDNEMARSLRLASFDPNQISD